MKSDAIIPRLATARLLEALADTPAVLLHGPRQSGKTTLAQASGREQGYVYFNLDDDVLRHAAEQEPVRFVGDLPGRAILDEVQRVPAVFTSLKSAIDNNRTPGRFLLTGSANVLLVPRLADSLAGRMEIIRLAPLAQQELAKTNPTFLSDLFGDEFKIGKSERLRQGFPQHIVAGGYPAALTRKTPRRRAAWYRDYIEAIVQRDVRDLARIASLDTMPRLLTLIASQTSRLLNITELAAPFQVSRPTIRDYVTLLEKVFLADGLPPWHSNRLSRPVKTPKLHVGDTGLAAALLGMNAEDLAAKRELLGQFLETFVYQELRRQSTGHADEIRFYHLRDKDGYEVDLVLKKGTRKIAGVEVKAAASVSSSDFSGLRKLASAAGKRFAAGVVLYDGESSVSIGDSLYAVPLRRLWET